MYKGTNGFSVRVHNKVCEGRSVEFCCKDVGHVLDYRRASLLTISDCCRESRDLTLDEQTSSKIRVSRVVGTVTTFSCYGGSSVSIITLSRNRSERVDFSVSKTTGCRRTSPHRVLS